MEMKMRTEGWFEVDKEGLAQIVRRRGLAFIIYELVQNAWDTQATRAEVTIEPIPGRAAVTLTVFDDDPDGFKNLTHAYTMFAPSEKKGDPTRRGFLNLGEKHVLAVCKQATITTTTGTVVFEQEGKKLYRTVKKARRDHGSEFKGVIPMTRAELDEVLAAAQLLVPPVPTYINGEAIPARRGTKNFETTLPTVVSDEGGHLKRTARKTQVELFDPGDQAYLYEMGIPVVEIDLPWSVNVQQKVPVNSERDNVTPSYRKTLCVAVLNEMHREMEADDAANPLIQEALESPDVDPEAVESVLTRQYGDKRVTFDPSDPEANQNAVAHGYALIPGRAFSKIAWENIRRAGASESAGKLFPTPKSYNPDGDPARIIPESKWTDGMKAVADYAKMIGRELLDANIQVVMEAELTQPYVANYGHRCLTFNAHRLGKKWFDLKGNFRKVTDLILHEFGHHYASSHLDAKYHDALTRLGADLTLLALEKPKLFGR
jgi:hypothetical protein